MIRPIAAAPAIAPSPAHGRAGELLYPTRCYRALAPGFLAAAAAAHGVWAPAPGGPYRYCEPGCGTGLTLAVLAAANPRCRFTGIEGDPAHAAAARELAGRCGLDNLHIVEADLRTLDPDTLPDYQFIALHGVYSWVDDSVRAALRRLLARRLVPGGLAYVSYNAMPGWSGLLAVRRWLQRRVAALGGVTTDNVLRARDELLTLKAQSVPFFTDTPVAAAVTSQLAHAEAGYIVHEYLMPGWSALGFDEVQPAMAAVGLEYAGEAELPGTLAPCDAHAACRTLAADRGQAAESERDFLHRFFRRDLYRRPARGRDEPPGDPFDQVLLATLVPPAVLGGDGSARGLDPMALAGLRAVLGEDVVSYAELRATPPFPALPEPALRRTVLTLLGRAELSACAHRALPAASGVGQANRVLADGFGLAASPLTGGVIALHDDDPGASGPGAGEARERLLARHGAVPDTSQHPPPPTGASTP